MVFEDVTALELHLHLGDEERTDDRDRSISRPTTRENDVSASPNPLLVATAALVGSVTVSIAVTQLVRKLRSRRD